MNKSEKYTEMLQESKGYTDMLQDLLSLFQSVSQRINEQREASFGDCLYNIISDRQAADKMTAKCDRLTGTKIRAIRQFRKMPTKYLATACGVTPACIRFYERGEREPDETMLGMIAKQLDVPPSAIREHNLNSPNDCIHVLFEIEELGLFDSATFQDFIKFWKIKRQQLASGELTEEEYRQWKYELFVSEFFDIRGGKA